MTHCRILVVEGNSLGVGTLFRLARSDGSIVFGAARPGYDLTRAISELGQQGWTNAIAWNVLGFGVSGILYALFAVAIRARCHALRAAIEEPYGV